MSIDNACHTAAVFNQLHPISIGFLSLTLFPESQLYKEISDGLFVEATEHERLDEMICLVSKLRYRTHILARTVSNPIPFTGALPEDRETILHDLREAKGRLTEKQLRSYRESIESL